MTQPGSPFAGLTPRAGAQVMDTDPYFWTQDNGAGAPVHFATTYKQLDMVRGMARCGDATHCSSASLAARSFAALARVALDAAWTDAA